MPPMRRPGQSAVDYIIETIAARISNDVYVPGQRLIEAELTADLGVSRGPLREALNRLAADGVIVVEPHRGAIVKTWTRKDIRAVFQVREALDGLAAKLAAENIHTSGFEQQLAHLRARMGTELPTDRETFTAHNAIFHDLVRRASENEWLMRQIGQLQFPTARTIYLQLADAETRASSLADHLHILDAILDGDSVAAEHFARKHVRRTALRFQDLVDGERPETTNGRTIKR